jgi:hypothetical protein
MVVRGVYKHFKGERYKVLGVATHSETGEPLVVYQSQTHLAGEELKTWARPLKMFEETVTVDGKEVPRFEFIHGVHWSLTWE